MLAIGEIKLVQGGAKDPYKVKNVDGMIYSCTCPGWRNSKGAVAQKTCKHVKAERGDAAPPPAVSRRTFLGGAAAVAGFAAAGAPLSSAAAHAAAPPPAPPATHAPVAKVGVLLAEKWEPSVDPTGYHMSEKLDGVRCIWNGERLLSRNGNPFPAPEWFTSSLPRDTHLDGELWCGRGNFQDAVSIVRSGMDKGWNKIKYMLFDIPSASAGTFEQRMAKLDALVKRINAPHVVLVTQIVCEGRAHLQAALDYCQMNGGEGLMLRKPGSVYEHHRSSTLLKVKTFVDCEALVLSHIPGKGKHVGSMGALHCKLPSGVEFDVGTGFTDKERDNPPRVGTTITVKYQELTRDGHPRFPVFVAVRDYEGAA